MFKLFKKITVSIVISFSFFGCMQTQLNNNTIDNKNMLTLGMVQGLKVGNTKSEITRIIGSPNIISKEDSREVWNYDKIYSEELQGKTSITALGASPIGVGVGFLGFSKEQSNMITSSKTLTVIIIFNLLNQVEKIDYHSSKY